MESKQLIGMIHLKALSLAPLNEDSIEEIYQFALEDLENLQKGGATSAIVENFFDTPYSMDLSIETVVSFTSIFTRLNEVSKIPLGINLQLTNGAEEIIIATLCNADFIRVESFVEERYTPYGKSEALSSKIMRKAKQLNSNVKIYSDINVKHSYPVCNQSIEESIKAAIEAGASAIILTGIETGKSPTLIDAKKFKSICKDIPLIVGSGVNKSNISDFLCICEGVIVGTSIKKDDDITKHIDVNRVIDLFE